MKKNLFLLFLLITAGVCVSRAQGYNIYGVGFYNLENLFDTKHDEGKNDYEYLPEGRNKWTEMKYNSKLRNMSTVLSEMGTDVLPGVGCAVIGVSEVENRHCLEDLVNQPKLKARNFKFVHVEGPDKRGVDCGLLYNPKFFTPQKVRLVPYVYEKKEDEGHATRGFLTVTGTLAGERITVIVCHWPSRGATSYYRELAGRQVRVIKDNLMKEDPNAKVIIMGDMNDDPRDRSMSVALGAKRDMKEVEPGGLYNPWWKLHDTGTGTLTFGGSWNLFDQIVVSYSLLHQEGRQDYNTLKFRQHQIFRRDYLFQQEGQYKGGIKRTHAGGVWLNGYSDHLPTIIYLMKEKK